jgi:hypothetical protein
MAGMRVVTESSLETNFCKWCKEHDIIPIKGPVAQSKGFPDRFVQLPNGGGTIYVEFKGTSNYDLTPMQRWWGEYLKNSNPNRYFTVSTPEELNMLKQRCLEFIAIGDPLVSYETKLLAEMKEE